MVLFPFSGVGVVSKVCVNIGIMLTFGLASPLLAITICIESLGTYSIWKCLITRYIYMHMRCDDEERASGSTSVNIVSPETSIRNALIAERDIQAPAKLNNTTMLASLICPDSRMKQSIDVDEAWQRLHHCTNVITAIPVVMWMIIVASGLFWALFVFDMYGDIYGTTSGACMVFLPTFGGITVYYCMVRVAVLYRNKYTGKFMNRTTIFDSELNMQLNDLKTPIMDPHITETNGEF
jgi:hypothetical protein